MPTHLEVVVHYRNDMPAGLPAVWAKDTIGGTVVVTLWLRHDLPQAIADAYRCMVTRDVFPDANLDAYAITDGNDDRVTMGPSVFA